MGIGTKPRPVRRLTRISDIFTVRGKPTTKRTTPRISADIKLPAGLPEIPLNLRPSTEVANEYAGMTGTGLLKSTERFRLPPGTSRTDFAMRAIAGVIKETIQSCYESILSDLLSGKLPTLERQIEAGIGILENMQLDTDVRKQVAYITRSKLLILFSAHRNGFEYFDKFYRVAPDSAEALLKDLIEKMREDKSFLSELKSRLDAGSESPGISSRRSDGEIYRGEEAIAVEIQELGSKKYLRAPDTHDKIFQLFFGKKRAQRRVTTEIIADIEAVEPYLAHHSDRVRLAAVEAIMTMGARLLQSAAVGGLGLADIAGGGLSFVSPDAGAMSLSSH